MTIQGNVVPEATADFARVLGAPPISTFESLTLNSETHVRLARLSVREDLGL